MTIPAMRIEISLLAAIDQLIHELLQMLGGDRRKFPVADRMTLDHLYRMKVKLDRTVR